ncbi:MAG: YibE/F family protein [Patescibacteria group bacterium]
MKNIKKICILTIFLALFFPTVLIAGNTDSGPGSFRAKVIEIVAVQEKAREDGSTFSQQDLKLIGLDGKWRDKEIAYNGISDIEVADAKTYQVGDKVFVDAYADETGETIFYVVDFVRTGYLLFLTAIFVAIVLLVGRWRGLKALLSLAISFFIIIKLVLPQILAGRDPFLVSLFGGLLILAIIIYLTEGFNKKSHLAVISVLFSLFITLTLSVIFTKLTRLSGLAQEEASFLIGLGGSEINFQGLLLAGFIIGAIGVLDDIIVGQIEAVEQIKAANPSLSSKDIFRMAYKVGDTHLGAIINTLFLTYAGAALPLLLLFIINQESGLTYGRLINTEIVSTEIVRTLVGSVGVIASMPIATFLAAIRFKR